MATEAHPFTLDEHEKIGAVLAQVHLQIRNIQSEFSLRYGTSNRSTHTAAKLNELLVDLRHELDELVSTENLHERSDRIIHCYYPPREEERKVDFEVDVDNTWA